MKKLFMSMAILFSVETIIASDIKQPFSSRYGYIENKGQIINQNNQPNPAVKYLFNGNGLNVQLKESGFGYDTYTIERIPKTKSENESLLPDKYKTPDEDLIYHFHRIDIEFIGANKFPKIIAEQPSSDYTNYYTTGTPEEGVTFVRTYQKVTYRNLYEGIDLEFNLTSDPSPLTRGVASRDGNAPLLGRGAEGEVKYNFIIHPGADVSQIKWKYNGAFNTSLQNGKIILTVESGDLEEQIPSSFIQENLQAVNANYISYDDNTFGFSVSDYNKHSTLIIDPVPWATYYGGSGAEYCLGSSADASGNIVITGYTNSTSGIATTGAYQTTYYGGNGSDVFIAKFNASGSLLWGTYYGGNHSDWGYGISSDTSGNSVITGITYSDSGFATTGAFQTIYGGGGHDAFIAKFNASGFLLWSSYYGGSGEDYAYGVTLGANGNSIITGATNSISNIASPGVFQTMFGGGTGSDVFIAKFNAFGSRIWGTYFGGSGSNCGTGISEDISGNILITGYTSADSSLATQGAFQTTFGGNGTDVFIAKFNASGTLQWGTYYGGNGNDAGHAITADLSGNILITGYTNSSGFATTGAYQTTHGGGTYDAFIAKFSASGSRLWGTYFGGNSNDVGDAISVDASGNCAITGYTLSSSNIASSGAFQTTYGGNYDAFIAKFNALGSRLWSTYLGGSGVDYGRGIIIDAGGNISTTGVTNSTSGIATPGTYQTTYGGATSDAFIAEFTANGGLPVKLLSVEAKLVNENKEVLLSWQTASEENNDHFEVERSVDNGQCSHNEATAQLWSGVGRVKGRGTSSVVNNYQFTDNLSGFRPLTSNIYYRLKQVDYNGMFEYSTVVSVRFDNTVNEIIICPNPNSGIFDITPQQENTTVEVFDLTGIKVYSASVNSSSQINLSRLNKGIYYLKCISENGIQTKKVFIE